MPSHKKFQIKKKKAKAKTNKNVVLPGIFKTKRGSSSNTYLHRFTSLTLAERIKLHKGINPDSQQAIVKSITKVHRIKPIAKKKGSIYDSQTGHHEWIPTNYIWEVMQTNDNIWIMLATIFRSPTWLIIQVPDITNASYQQAITKVLTGNKVDASDLGLQGHSGGLSLNGTQQTVGQAGYHDELRDIFKKYKDTKDYAGYFKELIFYIKSHFLFVEEALIPSHKGDIKGNLLDNINWDYTLSERGNPIGAKMDTLKDVAEYLNAQWKNFWLPTLCNSFTATLYNK